MSVTIPRKALRQVMDAAKKAHTQNIELSVVKGKACFKMCENDEIVEIQGIREGK